MSLGQHELTDLGKGYLSQAQLGAQFKILKMVVGKGVATTLPDQLWGLTSLISYVMDITISNSAYIAPDEIKVTGVLQSLNVPTGGSFALNEVGLIAQKSDGTQILYSVANTGGGGDIIPDKDNPAAITEILEVHIKVDRVQNVTINFQPAGIYDCVNRGDPLVGPGPYIANVGNVFNFKRFKQGKGIAITDTDNGDTITVGLQMLAADLDVYVPVNHPLAPNSNVAFPTVQAAHDYLENFIIPPERVARINVWAGWVSLPTTTIFTHPNGAQIQLLGAAPIVQSATVASASGTVGNYTIPIVVQDGTKFKAGDHVYFQATGGNLDWLAFDGYHKIVSISGNTINVLSTFRASMVPGSTAYGQVCLYTSQLICAQGGIQFKSSLGYMNNIGFIGPAGGGYNGLQIFEKGLLGDNIGIAGFDVGVLVDGGARVNLSDTIISSTLVEGWTHIHGSQAVSTRLEITGCIGNGLNCTSGATLTAGHDCRFIGNTLSGVTAQGGYVVIDYGNVVANLQWGCFALVRGTISCGSSNIARNGGGYDLLANGGSYIGAPTIRNYLNQVINMLPAGGTVGNNNSYIAIA